MPSESRTGMPVRSRPGSPETLPSLEPPCDSNAPIASCRIPRTSRPEGPSREALTKLPVTSEIEEATDRPEVPPVSMPNGLESDRGTSPRRGGAMEAKISKPSAAPPPLVCSDTSDGATEEASSRADAARELATLPLSEGAGL